MSNDSKIKHACKTEIQITPEQAYILLSESIICKQTSTVAGEMRKNFKLLSPQNHHLMKIGCRLKIFNKKTLEYKGSAELLSRFNFPKIKIQTVSCRSENTKKIVDTTKVYVFFKVPLIPALTNFETKYKEMDNDKLNEEFKKRFKL